MHVLIHVLILYTIIHKIKIYNTCSISLNICLNYDGNSYQPTGTVSIYVNYIYYRHGLYTASLDAA